MDLIQPQPSDNLIIKHANSAFIGTQLEEHLRHRGIQHLVMTGLTTEHCVSATTRTAADLGFTVTLVCDAVANFDKIDKDGQTLPADLVQRVSLACLKDEFATLVDTVHILQGTWTNRSEVS